MVRNDTHSVAKRYTVLCKVAAHALVFLEL
jgi:hypothetical protein